MSRGGRPAREEPTPPPPLPPADLATRDLDPVTLQPRQFTRIHWPGGALSFSPASGPKPRGRFDAPAGQYRTHYSGFTFAAAFVEAMLRQEQPPILALSDIQRREVSMLETARPLQLLPLHGPRLRRIGATAAVAAGPYSASRQWGLALWQWTGVAGPLDGIIYRSRHDDEQWCLALFDRAATAMRVVATDGLATRLAEILMLRRDYRFPLDLMS